MNERATGTLNIHFCVTGVPVVGLVPGTRVPRVLLLVPGTWYQACVAGEYFWARLVPVPVPVYLVHWLCYVMLC